MILKPWTLLYIGASLSVGVCFSIIYFITISGDTSIEWIIWIFFALAILLVAGGYEKERRYKRKHPQEHLSKYEEYFKEQSIP